VVVVVVAAIVVVVIAAAVCPNTAVGKEYWMGSLPKAAVCASKWHGVTVPATR